MSANDGSRLVLIHPIANNRESWQFLEFDAFEHPPVDRLVEELDGPLDLLGIAVGAFVALL